MKAAATPRVQKVPLEGDLWTSALALSIAMATYSQTVLSQSSLKSTKGYLLHVQRCLYMSIFLPQTFRGVGTWGEMNLCKEKRQRN